MEHKNLRLSFMNDLHSISESLLVALKIPYKIEPDGIKDPMFRWLDFRLRYIDPKPRRIHTSKKLIAPSLPTKYQKALSRVIKKIQLGEDVNPMQGKGLSLHHDTSVANRAKRTDLLWADWGIHHLHLSTEPGKKDQYYTPRSDWLLYVVFLHEDAILIDVGQHKQANAFENTNLLKTLIRDFPNYAGKFRLEGVLPGNEISAAEVRGARLGGVMTSIVVDGFTYIAPGLGISTASTSNRVSMEMINISRFVEFLARIVSEEDGEIQTALRKQSVSNPKLSLALTSNGIGVYEENLNICWMSSRPYISNQETPIERLRDLFTPTWLVDLMRSKTATSSEIERP